ncbi:hypothetical protein ACF08W_29030 [Streptomyces sp. NPDC015144]|uniref:hypothetical protein n=1 Tax=Streptomyces sp. NPDC015144 TaxID=3364944 RepID=UPI0036F6CDC2
MSEPTPTLMIVTCRTAGCPNADESFTVRMYPNVEEPVWAAMCAGCDQMVQDIVPATPSA